MKISCQEQNWLVNMCHGSCRGFTNDTEEQTSFTPIKSVQSHPNEADLYLSSREAVNTFICSDSLPLS